MFPLLSLSVVSSLVNINTITFVCLYHPNIRSNPFSVGASLGLHKVGNPILTSSTKHLKYEANNAVISFTLPIVWTSWLTHGNIEQDAAHYLE